RTPVLVSLLLSSSGGTGCAGRMQRPGPQPQPETKPGMERPPQGASPRPGGGKYRVCRDGGFQPESEKDQQALDRGSVHDCPGHFSKRSDADSFDLHRSPAEDQPYGNADCASASATSSAASRGHSSRAREAAGAFDSEQSAHGAQGHPERRQDH